MHGEDRLRSFKKFSAIALVLTLGAAFHGICWSSLVWQSGVLEPQPMTLGCRCVEDHRFQWIPDQDSARSCEPAHPEHMVSRP
jgi:hypothetical protein